MTDFAAIWNATPRAVDHPELVPVAERGFGGRTSAAGLALSGGGFRAMLFHVGTLRRLYEIGALRHIHRISSVSGGSITAARLALGWNAIHAPGAGINEFEEEIQRPLFDFAASRIDAKRGVLGVVTPGQSIADKVSQTYDQFFSSAGLQQLPDAPRFVFCATNLGTGSLVRFAKRYTADYRIGKRDNLDLPLGSVVAASAAFPPVLSPMIIELEEGQGLTEQFPLKQGERPPALAGKRPFTHRLELTDGGVYDNLGLQPVNQYHTLLVSDGGGAFAYDDSVPVNWLGHVIRCWQVTDNQVRSLRREELVSDFVAGRRNGVFWGIRTDYRDFTRQSLPVHPDWPNAMQAISTRLWTIPEVDRKRLINWAYCVTDAAVRSHIDDGIDPPPVLPYPEEPLDGPPPEKARPWWKRIPGLG